jgi:cell shape-determining protein MreC
MEFVVNDEKVSEGDAIVTSGEDHIFPKDLPIGVVREAKPGNPFQVIRVQPAARLDRLEDVIVLLTQQQLTPLKTAAASNAAQSQTAAKDAGAPAASAKQMTLAKTAAPQN